MSRADGADGGVTQAFARAAAGRGVQAAPASSLCPMTALERRLCRGQERGRRKRVLSCGPLFTGAQVPAQNQRCLLLVSYGR